MPVLLDLFRGFKNQNLTAKILIKRLTRFTHLRFLKGNVDNEKTKLLINGRNFAPSL